MRCEEIHDRGIIQGYVAGRLDDRERETFEEHFFGCDECHEAVEVATAVREGFASGARAPGPGIARSRRVVLAAAAVLLIAAAVGFYELLRPAPDPRIAALGTLERAELPPYLPSPAFRGPTEADAAARLFETGMEAYVEGDLEEAAELLQSSLALEPHAGRSLYLGSALLALGDPRAALQPLELASTHPALTERSRYYLARAYLQLGRAEEALEALTVVEEGGAELAQEARRLADMVRQAMEDRGP